MKRKKKIITEPKFLYREYFYIIYTPSFYYVCDVWSIL